MSTSAAQALRRAQTGIKQALLGQQNCGSWNHRIPEDTEVVPVHVTDVVVLIGAEVWLSPNCAEPPTRVGAKEEKLLPPTMNGRGKTLKQGALRSWTETPPTFSVRVPSQHEESLEQGNTRSDLVEEAKNTKGECHPNRVRSQLRRDKVVEPKQTQNKLRDRKPETPPQRILIDR